MLPTIRQLQYLKLLATHQSFVAAAQAAYVSQPALSSGIAELEKTLGVKLVDRARGRVILTTIGEDTLERAHEILALTQDLVEAVDAVSRPLSGRFRMGVIPTIAPFLLPRALSEIKKNFAQLRLYLREDQTHNLIEKLKSGELDCAIIALPYDVSGLDFERISKDELLIAMPTNHRFVNQTSINPGLIQASEMILLEDGHCLREHARAACGWSQGRLLNEALGFAATSLATLIAMVEAGLGLAILPKIALESGLVKDAQIAIRPIQSEQAYREICVAWRQGSSRRIEARLIAQSLREQDKHANA